MWLTQAALFWKYLHVTQETSTLVSYRQWFTFLSTGDKSESLSLNCYTSLLDMFFYIPEDTYITISVLGTKRAELMSTWMSDLGMMAEPTGRQTVVSFHHWFPQVMNNYIEINIVLFQKIHIPPPQKVFWFDPPPSPHSSGNSNLALYFCLNTAETTLLSKIQTTFPGVGIDIFWNCAL